jgi:hypothetical protein
MYQSTATMNAYRYSISSLFARRELFLSRNASALKCPCKRKEITNQQIRILRLAIEAHLLSPSEPKPNCWDVSVVTHLSGLFQDIIKSFHEPIDNWDTEAATDMYKMFYNAEIFIKRRCCLTGS